MHLRSLQDPKVRDVVRGYLDTLPAQLQAVYEQRYVLGRTQAAACATLGMSRSRLRTSEDHLKRRLRKALRAGGMSPLDIDG